MAHRNPKRRWRKTRAFMALAGVLAIGYGAWSLMGAPRPFNVSTALAAHISHAPKPPKRSTQPAKNSSHTRSVAKPLPASYLIHVPGKDQYPQLPNGCEVTSLAMLMTAEGHPVSKMTLAAEMPKDPTKLVLTSYTTSNGKTANKVQFWGNPNIGFVGSVYKAGYGYGIYNAPMYKFLNQLLPGRALNMTGDSFSAILQHVAQGIPVEVWTTTTFQPTTDWVTWQSPEGPVTATPYEHAVLVVGYSPGYLYINNPLNGEAAQKVAEGPFLGAWQQLGKQAITVKS